jgi:hypothetical protein
MVMAVVVAVVPRYGKVRRSIEKLLLGTYSQT